MSLVGADLLSETLADLAHIIPKQQIHENATLAPIMKREDGLIDWNMSALEIANRVRGFQPFPAAFTLFNGQKLTFWKAKAEEQIESGKNGEVLEASGDNFLIRCGGGTVLRVEELQHEGKRRMSVRDFLNGTRLIRGDILGA